MKPTTHTTFKANALFLAIMACFSAPLYAGMTGVTSTNDPGAINNPNDLTTTNRNAIFNANGFGVIKGETWNLIQPDAASRTLIRINLIGGSPTEIAGTITSNGGFTLINPHGAGISAGAIINVPHFVFSSLNISDEDYLAHRLNFTASPFAGNISNAGTIKTPTGGRVYLIGTQVENTGTIETPGGETILAAGQTVQLIDTSTPGVRVEITGDQNQATNLGTIVAESGRIGIVGVLVKNSGTLNANSVVSEGGRIFLRATSTTIVDGNSNITATGTKGGHIEALGNIVAVMDNAKLDASGTNGGGTVLVGGDFQGKNAAVQNAQVTYFGPDASLKADATDNGDGGKVIVWADDTTRAYGNISARGGANGGDGGFVEVSGKKHLQFAANVDTLAAYGKTGTLLLDPNNLQIITGSSPPPGTFDGSNIYQPQVGGGTDTIGWTNILCQLGSGCGGGSNLILQTSSASTGPFGDITFVAGTYAYSGTNSLSFFAERNISMPSGTNLSSNGDINMIAGWNGNLSNPGITGSSGAIDLVSSNISTTGNLSMTAANYIKINNASSISGNTVNLTAQGDIDLIPAAGGPSSVIGNNINLKTTGNNADLFLGNALVGNNATINIDLDAQGTGSQITQSVSGVLEANNLNAIAGDKISLLGTNNKINSVTAMVLSSGTDILKIFNNQNLSVDSITNTGSSGGVEIGVTNGAILTGSGTGITGNSIYLHSDNGSNDPNTLAISADVTFIGPVVGGSSPSLSATSGGSYGNINIRSTGTMPSNLYMATSSPTVGQGNITYYHDGALTLNGFTTFSTTAGDINILAGGNINLASFSGGTPGLVNRSVTIGSDADITTSANQSFAGNLKLYAGGALNIAHTFNAAQDLYLVGSAINIGNDVTATQDLYLAGGSVNINLATAKGIQNTYVSADSLSITNGKLVAFNENVYVNIYNGGDIRLTATTTPTDIQAGNDIYLGLDGTTSNIFLDGSDSDQAKITSGAMTGAGVTSIYFSSRSADGIDINGSNTLTNDGNTGFFGGGGTAAIEGSNLFVTYGTTDSTVLDQLTTALDDTSKDPGTTDDGTTLPPISESGSDSLLKDDGSDTIGGTAGNFGDESTLADNSAGSNSDESTSGSADEKAKEADNSDGTTKKEEGKQNDKKPGQCA